MNTFPLRIVSPAGLVFETEEANKVTARTKAGEITILANHTPIVSVLDIGQLVVKTTKKEARSAVFGGVIEVRESGEVIVLADEAQAAADIDLAAARKAREEKQNILEETPKQGSEADLQAQLAREVARVKAGSWYQNQEKE